MSHATTYTPEEGPTVVTFVRIEPAPEQRQQFARWCLAQTPRIETSGHGSSDVPVDLYPDVPQNLLEGAYVDGYLYRGTDPVPAVRTDGTAPPTPVAEPKQKPRQRQRARKTTQPRKAAEQ